MRLVLVAGHVRRGLDRDLEQAARELRPVGPGDDLDARRRLDGRRLDRRQVERDALLAPLLDEAAPLGKRQAVRVVVGDDRLERVELAFARPVREGLVERRAGAAASMPGRNGDHHPRALREAREQRGEAGAEYVAAFAGEQVWVVEQACLEGLHVGEPELLVRPRLEVDVERELLFGLVRDRGNLDHAATLWLHIRGRPGFDVVGSPAELQAEVPGRPRKTTGKQRKCEERTTHSLSLPNP